MFYRLKQDEKKAGAIRMTVVPITPLICTTVMPIKILIGTTVLRINGVIGTTVLVRKVAGQLSDSLKFFVGQKRKMPDKNNRVLLYFNTSPSKFSKIANFMINSQNTQEICATFIH